jgi:hypothetical protein
VRVETCPGHEALGSVRAGLGDVREEDAVEVVVLVLAAGGVVRSEGEGEW